MWQLYVKNHDGRSITVNFNKSIEELFVSDLKKEVEKKTGIPPNEQRLIYAGKSLEDEKELSEYPTLGPRSTVFLVRRLLGGTEREPFDPMIERTLPKHLPKSADNDFCYICYSNPALLMPCNPTKHSMCSTCLINYSWEESRKKPNICCSKCGSEWGLDVIKEYGQATEEEIRLLAETLSRTAIQWDPTITTCPGCDCYCERKDTIESRVRCRTCSKNGKKNPDFCWHCLHPWESSTNECGNKNCNAESLLAQIEDAPMTEVVGVSCPSIRLCPRCGCAIEHASGCKHMTCITCNTDFCFICLRIRVDGSWQCGSYNTQCEPAPKQTTVPRI